MVFVEKDMYSEHVKNVKALAAVGISPPAEWTAIHKRLTEYLALDTPVRAQLIDAIGEGKGGDIAALRAGAYAEAAVVPTVNRAVIAGVHARLLQVYAGHARKNYVKLALEFNDAAKEFTTIAGIVNPDIDAASVVGFPEDQRQAWLSAPLVAAELDKRLPALRAAAELCGVSTKAEQFQLAMVVDPAAAHRRRVWEGWASDGRAGRWSGIVKSGAKIHADPLDKVAPYRRPKPLEQKTEHRNGLVVVTTIDPEDVESQATAVA